MKKYCKYINQNKIEVAPEIYNGVVGFCYNEKLCKKQGFDKILIEVPKTGDKTVYELQGDFVIQKWVDEPKLLLEIANPFLKNYSEEEIKAQDITMLDGLYNFKRYRKGYKIYSRFFIEEDYKDGETIPAVERLYSLVFDEDNFLIGEKTVMNWYNDNGEIAFSKELIESFSAKDSALFLKKVRDVRIAYLQNPEKEYVKMGIKPYVDKLFEHYKEQVTEYLISGNDVFKEAIENEKDPVILKILNTPLGKNMTFRDHIINQIAD